MIDGFMIVAGLALLFYGGEGLVNGSVAISQRLGISKVLIGVVVVGFGTSTPELLVSIKASLAGQPDIALGNVVGSNIANVLLILGTASLLAPIACKDFAILRDAFAVFVASLMLYAFTFLQIITLPLGILMLATLIGYLLYSYRVDKKKNESQITPILDEQEETDQSPTMSLRRAIFFTVGGIGLLIVGADALVEGASSVARQFGISEAVIGLSLVAIGTSLPELAAALAASAKKQSDIVIGNILGSNLFNVLSILGITAIIKPVPLGGQIASFDIPLTLGISVIIFGIIAIFKNINRLVGLVCLVSYIAYITWLYIGGTL